MVKLHIFQNDLNNAPLLQDDIPFLQAHVLGSIAQISLHTHNMALTILTIFKYN